MKEKKYGLLTSITMVIGIVIGSGIFFKTDDILIATDGNVMAGALAFIVGAFSMIFGGLAISQIASRDDKAGGIITYSEQGYGKNFSYYVGMFQILVYYPCLAAIISWVAGIYTGILFGFDVNSLTHWVLSTLYLFGLYVINTIAKKTGGYFQNITTFIKLIPLFLIAILGIFCGKANPEMIMNSGTLLVSTSALVAVAFAFDGWIVSTSICHEVKNAKRNIPLALVIAPMIVLGVYLLYYFGIVGTIGADKVIELGDSHVKLAVDQLLGGNAYKLITIAIIISILGTVNGLILGLIRLPYSLGIRKEIPLASWVSKESSRTQIPVNSAIISIGPVLFWYLFHYMTFKINAISTFDISALPILANYVFYMFLYVYVIRLARKKEIKSVVRGYIVPIFAIIGGMMVLYSGIIDKNFISYVIVSAIAIFISYILKVKDKNKPVVVYNITIEKTMT